MEYPKLYKTLESIIDSGSNPFDLSYWTPVYFHPYTSLVNGYWFGKFGDNYSELETKVKDLPSFEDFDNFCHDVRALVIHLGYVVPVNPNWFSTEHVRHDFDNKVAISLLGKNEEILIIGWKDNNLCIGTELGKPFCSTDCKSYSINQDSEEFLY